MLRLSYFETLAHQLENKISTARQNPQLVGEHFVPITTGLASLLDQVRMTRDLIERLVSMQGVFGRNQGSGKDGDFGALVNLAADVAARVWNSARQVFSCARAARAQEKTVHALIRQVIDGLVNRHDRNAQPLPFRPSS